MEGEEAFDQRQLVNAARSQRSVWAMASSCTLKGARPKLVHDRAPRANEFMLDEMDRSVHDRFVLSSGCSVQPPTVGGGAVETALSIYLESFATTLGSREQLAVHEFAEALLVIPKTLAINAAQDAIELVSKLRAYHNTSQIKKDKDHYKWMGLTSSTALFATTLKQALWSRPSARSSQCASPRRLQSRFFASMISSSCSLRASRALRHVIRVRLPSAFRCDVLSHTSHA